MRSYFCLTYIQSVSLNLFTTAQNLSKIQNNIDATKGRIKAKLLAAKKKFSYGKKIRKNSTCCLV